MFLLCFTVLNFMLNGLNLLSLGGILSCSLQANEATPSPGFARHCSSSGSQENFWKVNKYFTSLGKFLTCLGC